MLVLGRLKNAIVLLLLLVRLVLRAVLILLVVPRFERNFRSRLDVKVASVGVLLRSRHLAGDEFWFLKKCFDVGNLRESCVFKKE